jgi:hypothetical protein
MALAHDFFKGVVDETPLKLKSKNITLASNKLGNVGNMVM